MDVCAVLEDPATTPATEKILGGVEFTWLDTLGAAVLTVTGHPPAAPWNAIHEAPGFQIGIGNSINVIAKLPTAAFLKAMKRWNPQWPAP
jgi:hypothetical protein